jgi:Tfp pilus assembly protein PilF
VDSDRFTIRALALLAVLLLPLLAYVAWRRRDRQPWLLMGLLWYLVTLLPVSGVVTIAHYSHADRYMYLPLVGVFVAAVWSIPAGTSRRLLVSAGLCTYIVCSALAAWQVSHWRNTETLSRRADAIYPGHHWIRLYRLMGLVEEGRYEEALEIGRQLDAPALGGDNPRAQYHLQMGNAEAQRGNVPAALHQWGEAATIYPAQWRAFHNIGRALTAQGRLAEAQRAFDGAFAAYDQAPELWIDFARLALAQGQVDEAGKRFRQAIEVASRAREPEVVMEYARYLRSLGKTDEALLQLGKVLSLQPRHSAALELQADIRKAAP